MKQNQQRAIGPYDYDNNGYPRDFDIRIEAGGQQEVVRESVEHYQKSPKQKIWHTSEYDF